MAGERKAALELTVDALKGCCLTPLHCQTHKAKGGIWRWQLAQAPPHVTGASPKRQRLEVTGMRCFGLTGQAMNGPGRKIVGRVCLFFELLTESPQ